MGNLTRRSILTTLASFSAIGLIFSGRANADQPHMQIALDALRKAQAELQTAEEDKGGHRVKALKLVSQAINQVQLGINYDRRH